MIEFYEKHKDDKDLFEIIALHSTNDVKTFEELDSKLTPKIREAWKGKDLPFPVLLDGTHQTLDNYGISIFPTTILIDPEGKLSGYGNEKILEKKIEDLRRTKRGTK